MMECEQHSMTDRLEDAQSNPRAAVSSPGRAQRTQRLSCPSGSLLQQSPGPCKSPSCSCHGWCQQERGMQGWLLNDGRLQRFCQ